MMILYYIYECTKSRDYVHMEKAALRILKTDQEKADSIMISSFNLPRKNDFVIWEKPGEMED